MVTAFESESVDIGGRGLLRPAGRSRSADRTERGPGSWMSRLGRRTPQQMNIRGGSGRTTRNVTESSVAVLTSWSPALRISHSRPRHQTYMPQANPTSASSQHAPSPPAGTAQRRECENRMSLMSYQRRLMEEQLLEPEWQCTPREEQLPSQAIAGASAPNSETQARPAKPPISAG